MTGLGRFKVKIPHSVYAIPHKLGQVSLWLMRKRGNENGFSPFLIIKSVLGRIIVSLVVFTYYTFLPYGRIFGKLLASHLYPHDRSIFLHNYLEHSTQYLCTCS